MWSGGRVPPLPMAGEGWGEGWRGAGACVRPLFRAPLEHSVDSSPFVVSRSNHDERRRDGKNYVCYHCAQAAMTTTTAHNTEKLPPIHPGEVLNEEFLLPMSVTQYRLAKAIGVDTHAGSTP